MLMNGWGGEPERLASGVKLDIGNPVALAPAQAGLFILALEGCRRASEQPSTFSNTLTLTTA